MSQSPKDPGPGLRGGLLAGGAVVLAVVCCAAGPVLLAGVLGVAGGVLRSPAVLTLAALVLIGAVLYTLTRRGRARRAGTANPTVPADATPHGAAAGRDMPPIPRASADDPTEPFRRS